MRRALLLLSVLMLAACGGGGNEAARGPVQSPPPTLPADLLSLYAYDKSAPFDVRETKTQEQDGATVHDISYAEP